MAAPCGPPARPRRREGIVGQQAGGSYVLLDPDDGRYFSLNEVGGRIWELADGTNSTADIVRRLEEEYEAPAGAIEADVRALLADLAADGLVV